MCHFSRIILDTNEIHEHCCGVVSYCFVLSDLKVQIAADRQTDKLDTCVHVLGSVHTELLAIAVQKMGRIPFLAMLTNAKTDRQTDRHLFEPDVKQADRQTDGRTCVLHVYY